MIPGNKKPAFTLHDVFLYVAVGAKHARLMLLLICFSLCVGLTYYVFAKPVFYSQALIDVDYLALPVDTGKIYSEGRLQSIITQLTAPHIITRTAHALGVNASAREIERKYVFKLRANFNSERNIQIHVWPYSAEWASRWTETMVNEFLAYRQEKRMEEKNLIIQGYASELRELVAKIDQQFSEKIDFQDQQDFTRTLILANTITNLPRELTRIQVRLEELGRTRLRLQDPRLDSVAKLSLIATANTPDARLTLGQTVDTGLGATPPDDNAKDPKSRTSAENVVVIPSLIDSAESWNALAKEQQHLKMQMEEASKVYLAGHRKMIDLNKQLGVVSERLEAEVTVAMNRFELQFQELLNKKHDYEGKLPEYQELSRKHAKLLSQLAIFDMSRLPYDRYFASLKKGIDFVDFGGEKERINLKYEGLIEYRDTPVSPNRFKVFLICMGAGIALAIGIPFLIEYLDHTLTNMKDVETTFQLRGLGMVPQSGHTEFVAPSRSDDPEQNSLIENFRVIRTNMLSMGTLSTPPHVVMVTSAMPKEGKTVVSSNLAASFALTGARTLLMDTDLRRGRMHRLFGFRKEPGLSNVLLGENTLDQAFRQTPHPNLTILSAGRHLASGTEMLGSPAFVALMTELRQRFDRIVVDTPPVLGLSETSSMQNLVDGVLFVIWTGRTPKRAIETAIETLRANGANFYGFVLNRLDLNTTQNYYQYYYYSHDYYYHQTIENA